MKTTTVAALRAAIEEGEASGYVEDFDFESHFMYSGRYPFSVPVIPVHFLGVKTDYLLRS